MASKTDILKELDFVTDKLSTQVRTTALGVLVFAWGLLVEQSTVARSVASEMKWHLLGIGGTAILAMFLDFLQYVSGYINARRAYKRMTKLGRSDVKFEDYNISYKLRLFFFYAKIIGLVLAVIWMLSVISYWLATSYG